MLKGIIVSIRSRLKVTLAHFAETVQSAFALRHLKFMTENSYVPGNAKQLIPWPKTCHSCSQLPKKEKINLRKRKSRKSASSLCWLFFLFVVVDSNANIARSAGKVFARQTFSQRRLLLIIMVGIVNFRVNLKPQ